VTFSGNGKLLENHFVDYFFAFIKLIRTIGGQSIAPALLLKHSLNKLFKTLMQITVWPNIQVCTNGT